MQLSSTLRFGLALTLFLAAGASGERTPNFVFFLVDDLGWRDLGCYGSDFYETPNVDRLRETGMKFTNAYAASPVCSPTRASIMTGKAPARLDTTAWFGAPQPEQVKNRFGYDRSLLPAHYRNRMPLEEVTIAEALKEAGYATYFAGKWHLGPRPKFWPKNQGFDVNRGGCRWGHPRSYFSPYNNPRLTDGPKGEYLPDRLGKETAEFIEDHADEPFLAYLSFYSVHTPLQTTERLEKKYRAKAKRMDAAGPKWGKEHGYRVRRVQDHPVYGGMVHAMDRAVGRVLDALDAHGLTKETVVIFMSDNGGLTTKGGPTSVRPLRAGKGWLYEGGIREPLLIRWPGVTEAGSTSSEPVISMDFYPTMLEMAGLERRPDQHRDGVSLVPLLRGADTLDRNTLYWHFPHYSPQGGTPTAAIRRGKWKLIRFFEDDHVELYNLEADVGESNDLASSRPEKAATLRKALDARLSEVDAPMPRPAKQADGLTGPDHSDRFAHVANAQVVADDLGHRMGSQSRGVALHEADKGLTGQVRFRMKLRATDRFPANGFLAIGEEPTDEKLVKCGLFIGGDRISIFEGKYPPDAESSKDVPLETETTYRLTVTVDTAADRVELTVRDPKGNATTVARQLTRPLDAVRLYGHQVIRTVTAFSPVRKDE